MSCNSPNFIQAKPRITGALYSSEALCMHVIFYAIFCSSAIINKCDIFIEQIKAADQLLSPKLRYHLRSYSNYISMYCTRLRLSPSLLSCTFLLSYKLSIPSSLPKILSTKSIHVRSNGFFYCLFVNPTISKIWCHSCFFELQRGCPGMSSVPVHMHVVMSVYVCV